jgi:hypothetical protein
VQHLRGEKEEVSTEWMDRAECRRHDPEQWFPVGEGESRAKSAAYALHVCRNLCPVRVQCSKHTRTIRRPIGIWAGVDLGDSASHAVSRDALAELDAITDGVSA